ncbi:MAG: globin domain-containing protein [Kineosporiaceae bacterium]
MARPSIFEAAGGDPAFLALAVAHHARCLADPELEHPFSHGVRPDHVERLAAYWAEVFGGPRRYSEAFGGHPAMITVHAGEGIGPELSARFVRCFVEAADDAALPADPALRAALRSYMEWATAEVESYSPLGSTAPATLPMPRWSWNGLEGYRSPPPPKSPPESPPRSPTSEPPPSSGPQAP